MSTKPSIQEEPGWRGGFTRHQAPEAQFANGTQVIKSVSEALDGHAVGVRGVILGSIHAPEVGTGYFVEWSTSPKVAVFVIEAKLSRAQ